MTKQAKAGKNKWVILNRGLYRWAAPRSVFVRGLINDRIQDLQRLPLWLRTNMRGRCQIKFGMTSLCNHAGFTLIELLVVVLIIGILAAIALPQYQKAVAKARATEAITIIDTMQKAISLWVMENGFPSKVTRFTGGKDIRDVKLDVDFPCKPIEDSDYMCDLPSGTWYAECYPGFCDIVVYDLSNNWYTLLSQMDSTGKWSVHKCGYNSASTSAKNVCESLPSNIWEVQEDWDY